MPATQTKTATFFSKDPTLRLVRVPDRRRYNEHGELEIIPGQRVEFLRHPSGLGILETEDERVIEWLRDHRQFNNGFYERGNEPGAVRPTVEERMGEIVQAAARGDAQTLAEIFDAENSTHRRDLILRSAETALKAQGGAEEGASDAEPRQEE